MPPYVQTVRLSLSSSPPFLIGFPITLSNTGSLTTGKGNRYVFPPPNAHPLTPFSLSAPRFVLASTQDLHEKINQLANRVRELEDALRTSHTLHSLEPHPLLSDELLRAFILAEDCYQYPAYKPNRIMTHNSLNIGCINEIATGFIKCIKKLEGALFVHRSHSKRLPFIANAHCTEAKRRDVNARTRAKDTITA